MTRDRAEAIRAAVCRCAGIEVEDMTGPGRHRSHVIARQVLAGVLRNEGMPLSSIGAVMGRDHSTVMWALGRLGDALLTKTRDVWVLWNDVHETMEREGI